MMRIIRMAFVLSLVLATYFSLWPVPIEPVVWYAPTAPGYTGVHATNTKLVGLRNIDLRGEAGPEHVVLGADGKLYAGGSLVVADAIKGLLSIAEDGTVTLLANTVAGGPISFPNAVVVAKDGKMYFTDSSMRFTPARWRGTLEAATLDVLEQSSTGRVLEYNPASKIVRVVAKGLSFANGIALSRDEGSLFVSESGKYLVWKIAVAAEQREVASNSAQARVFLGNRRLFPP